MIMSVDTYKLPLLRFLSRACLVPAYDILLSEAIQYLRFYASMGTIPVNLVDKALQKATGPFQNA